VADELKAYPYSKKRLYIVVPEQQKLRKRSRSKQAIIVMHLIINICTWQPLNNKLSPGVNNILAWTNLNNTTKTSSESHKTEDNISRNPKKIPFTPSNKLKWQQNNTSNNQN